MKNEGKRWHMTFIIMLWAGELFRSNAQCDDMIKKGLLLSESKNKKGKKLKKIGKK